MPFQAEDNGNIYDDFIKCISQVMALVAKTDKDKLNPKHVEFAQPILLACHQQALMLRDEAKCEQLENAMIDNFSRIACCLKTHKFADVWLVKLERKSVLSSCDPQSIIDEFK